VNVIAMALVMLSIATMLAAAPTAKQASPSPTKSSAPLSKWQRQQLEKFNNSAPADEYFGRMKLSYLGMNNTFHDAAIMSGDHTIDRNIVRRVEDADNALSEWAKKFPHDPQLARTYFLAIGAEKRIWLKPNQERAWIYMNRIVQLFPTSYFGKLVKKDLAIGFTEHYYADPVPCATPTPTPTPTPTETPTASPTPEPRRGRRPAPTPSPSPTPEPTPPPTPEPTQTPIPRPTPSVIAKGLKVQIEIPPCVPPATPSPSPSPSPSEAASPLFQASPAATGSASPLTPATGASVAPTPAAAPSVRPSPR
jgi:hypothetical protein